MKRRDYYTIALVVALVLAAVGSVGLGLAEEPIKVPALDEQVQPQGVGAEALLSTSIPVQGKLTDAGGTPLNGTVSVSFRLYDVATGGTAQCTSNKTVSVVNGLFSDTISGCDVAFINGRQLYLGVKVGSDPEMTPRQPIYAVPYAMSLRPGAKVEGAQVDGPAIQAYNTAATGYSYGVRAISLSPSGAGIFAENYGRGIGAHVYGNGKTASGAALRVHNPESDKGMAGYITNNSDYATTHFANAGTGEVLYLESRGGAIIRGINTDTAWSEVFRVKGDGDVTQTREADGLVKAGVAAICGSPSSILRSFNNVGGTIAVTPVATGECIVNFAFKVDDRYWVAMAQGQDRLGTCTSVGGNENVLRCYRTEGSTGIPVSGYINILVY